MSTLPDNCFIGQIAGKDFIKCRNQNIFVAYGQCSAGFHCAIYADYDLALYSCYTPQSASPTGTIVNAIYFLRRAGRQTEAYLHINCPSATHVHDGNGETDCVSVQRIVSVHFISHCRLTPSMILCNTNTHKCRDVLEPHPSIWSHDFDLWRTRVAYCITQCADVRDLTDSRRLLLLQEELNYARQMVGSVGGYPDGHRARQLEQAYALFARARALAMRPALLALLVAQLDRSGAASPLRELHLNYFAREIMTLIMDADN